MNEGPGKPLHGFVDTPETRAELDRLELIAEWMDRRFLDPLINIFVPGAGNTISSIIGLYAVVVAARLRVSPVVIARMLINLALDSLIGAIPVFGWLGDFFYRAHIKNLELIKERGEGGEATGGDWFVVLLAGALFLFAVSLPIIIVLSAGYLLFTLT